MAGSHVRFHIFSLVVIALTLRLKPLPTDEVATQRLARIATGRRDKRLLSLSRWPLLVFLPPFFLTLCLGPHHRFLCRSFHLLALQPLSLFLQLLRLVPRLRRGPLLIMKFLRTRVIEPLPFLIGQRPVL